MIETTDFTACAVLDCSSPAEAHCASSDCGCSTTRCVCMTGHLVYIVVRQPECWSYHPAPDPEPGPTFGSPS